MVDFKKLKAAKAQPATIDPLEIFRRLPDLGSGVTVENGETLLIDARKLLADCNASLAVSDGLLTAFGLKEKELKKFNSKVLPAGGLKYGKDSTEYEKLGGVRESERKRPIKKAKT